MNGLPANVAGKTIHNSISLRYFYSIFKQIKSEEDFY